MSDDELRPEETQGYRAGEKKTLDEYAQLDAGDESLRRWKESLGIGGAPAASSKAGKPQLDVLTFSLEMEGKPDIVVDMTAPGALAKIRTEPFAIPEGVAYRMKATFRIQNDVVSGLRYLQLVKRSLLTVDKSDEMFGSYAPRETPYEKLFAWEEAPKGMLARGKYDVRSKFMDDDGVTYLDFNWCLEIKKASAIA